MNSPDTPEIAHAGAQLLHPGSRILFRHWESVRAERPCPERSDISLRAISKLMPSLAIIEMGQNINSTVFKLAGTAVCDLFQTQLTGAEVGIAMDRFERRVVDETLQLSVQNLQPCVIRMRFVSVSGTITTAELLALPVINTALGVNQLFCGVFAFGAPTEAFKDKLLRIELIATRMIWTEHQVSETLLNDMAQQAPMPFRVIQGGISGR
jgi:hypothetical protein